MLERLISTLTEATAKQFSLCENIITKTDGLNKRLTTVIIVAVISFCLTLLGMTYLYFQSDYTYPDSNVTQTNTQDVNFNTEKGGNE